MPLENCTEVYICLVKTNCSFFFSLSFNHQNKLERAHEVYGGAEGDAAIPEDEYHVIPSRKRNAPFSGFYSVRGRRTQGAVTSQVGDSQGRGHGQGQGQGEGQDRGDMLRLLDYYRALQEKRASAGQNFLIGYSSFAKFYVIIYIYI